VTGIWLRIPIPSMGSPQGLMMVVLVGTNGSSPLNSKVEALEMIVEGPYNKVSTVNTSGSRGVYNKFHEHFLILIKFHDLCCNFYGQVHI
jgi:hypothetical protein